MAELRFMRETIENYGMTSDEKFELQKYLAHMLSKNELNGIYDYYIGMEDKTCYFGGGWEPAPGEYDPTTRDWYKNSMNSEDVEISEAYVDADSGRVVITMSLPIHVDGKVVGVLAADIFTDDVQTKASEAFGEDDSKYVILLDKAGTVLAHKNPDFLPKADSDGNEILTSADDAGIPGNMAVDSLHTEIKDIKETVDVNFIGTFMLTKMLMPILEKNSGRIINVTVPSEISPYWHPLAYVASKAAQNAMMGVMAMEFQQSSSPLEIFSVHPGPTTTDLNGNMSLPGFHDIETVGQKMAELINDGKSHQGEFIELYPIVKED
jgi:NAD(P)-dependent dehydrogenase (short-subunit alcohol dehydrogenase family)